VVAARAGQSGNTPTIQSNTCEEHGGLGRVRTGDVNNGIEVFNRHVAVTPPAWVEGDGRARPRVHTTADHHELARLIEAVRPVRVHGSVPAVAGGAEGELVRGAILLCLLTSVFVTISRNILKYLETSFTDTQKYPTISECVTRATLSLLLQKGM